MDLGQEVSVNGYYTVEREFVFNLIELYNKSFTKTLPLEDFKKEAMEKLKMKPWQRKSLKEMTIKLNCKSCEGCEYFLTCTDFNNDGEVPVHYRTITIGKYGNDPYSSQQNENKSRQKSLHYTLFFGARTRAMNMKTVALMEFFLYKITNS